MAWTIQLYHYAAPEIGPLEERVDPVRFDDRLQCQAVGTVRERLSTFVNRPTTRAENPQRESRLATALATLEERKPLRSDSHIVGAGPSKQPLSVGPRFGFPTATTLVG